MDNPLLPPFLVLAVMVALGLLGIVEHFVERHIEENETGPAEHEGWEGEHAAELTAIVAPHLVERDKREDTARIRRDTLRLRYEPPSGDAS